MQQRCHYGLTALALGACFLAGCAATPPTGRGSLNTPASGVAAAKPAAPAPLTAEEQSVVAAHAHFAQATLLELGGDVDEALQEFTLAAQADPANESLALDLARRYLQRQKPEQALEVLLRATARPKASGALFSRLAQVYVLLGKDDPAHAAAETAIKRDPGNFGGYLNLFFLDLRHGRSKQALAMLDQASRQPKASVEFLIGLGELYAALERQAPSLKEAAKPGAAALLKRAADLNPAAPLLRLKLADEFSALGDAQSATRIYLELLEKHPDNVDLADEIHGKLAQIYLLGSDKQKAAEQLQGLLKNNPGYVQAYYVLGQLAVDARKYAEAADYFDKALILNDQTKEAREVYYALAELQIILDRVPQAFATLARARARYRENFTLEFLTARAYSKQKDYTNALVHFTTAEVVAKTGEPAKLNASFYFQVGATHERMGHIAEAETLFKKALALDPDFTEALNYYGYMLADRGEQLDAARQMIEKALRADPKNAAFIDSMAWVYYRLKQPAAALPLALQAIELNDEPDATLYEHLGDIYSAMHEDEKAREAWRHSIQIEKNPAVEKKLIPEAGR